MANYIFDDNLVNIHYHEENYQGGSLTAKIYEKSDFKAIESRYLNMMKAQMANQQGTEYYEKISNMIDEDGFKDLENQLSIAAAENYNENAKNWTTEIADYTKAVSDLKQALISEKTNDAIKTLGKIFSIFENGKNKSSNRKLKQMLQNPNKIQGSNIEQLMGINTFLRMINVFARTSKGEFNARYLSSALTKPSEGLSYIVSAYLKNKSDRTFYEALEGHLIGTQNAPNVKITFGDGFSKSIESKAADFKLDEKDLRLSTKGLINESGITLNYDLLTTYASAKVYEHEENTLKMVSYSGVNSLIIPTLRGIYPFESVTVKYQIYNGLAFNSYKQGNDLDKTWRVIRQDLILQHAEKYLVGASADFAQRVLIKNFVAYPFLTIFDALVQQLYERTGTIGDNPYGSFSNKDIFSVSIDRVNSEDRKWQGQEGVNSLYWKKERIKKVMSAIEKLGSQGKVNFSNLQEYLNNHQEIRGFRLFTGGL